MPLGVAGTIDVAEGTVAHLLKKHPSLEAGVLGELGPGGIFLSNELGQVGFVYASTRTFVTSAVFFAGYLFGRFGMLVDDGRLRDMRVGSRFPLVV